MPDGHPGKTLALTQTSGTGTYTVLTSVLTGQSYRNFDQAVADGSLNDGDTLTYVCFDGSVQADVSFECGEGVYDHTLKTITRDTIYDSSNGPGTPVNWPASGQRVIFVDVVHPSVTARTDRANTFTLGQKIQTVGGGTTLLTLDTTSGINFMDFKSNNGGSNFGTRLRFIDGGATDFEIQTVSDQTARLAPGGTALVYLSSTGVGIGVATPSVNLQVNGGTILNDSGGDNDIQIKGSTNDNLLYVDAGNDRIGIGTQSPSDRLTVQDLDPDIRVKGTQAGSSPGLILNNPAAIWRLRISGTSFGLADDVSATSPFTVEKAAPSSSLYIDASGQVGLGTSSPGATLDVRGNVVINEAGANNIGLRVEGDTDANLLVTDPLNDKIGIGTSSPARKLTVAGTSGSLLGVEVASKSGGSASGTANSIVIDSSTFGGISILTPNTLSGALAFGDSDAALKGVIQYNHATDILSITGNGFPMTVSSSGLRIGSTSAATDPVHVDLPTQDLTIADAGTAAATEQSWIECTVNGTTGYIRVFASK